MDAELRAELLARREEDQRVRQAAMGSGVAGLPPGLLAEWRRMDEANTGWLAELTERVGWPGRSLVGEDGARAAWLLAQHADQHPERQRGFLELLRAAVDAGEAAASDLAYLEDRVLVHDGQPQRYGTQFIRDAQGLRPRPVEDPEHLDERRAAVGLGPFAEYEALMRRRD